VIMQRLSERRTKGKTPAKTEKTESQKEEAKK